MNRSSGGIPAPERLVGRLLVWSWSRRRPVTATAALLRVQQRELVGLIERAGDRATERKRIKRLPGLEASSCDWSMAMVADHLARTNRDMARTIERLTRGEPGGQEVVIANYKPSPDASVEPSLSALDESIVALEGVLAEPAAIRASRAMHAHPWFGSLRAGTWAVFPTFHQAVHLKQARLISDQLA